MRTLIEELADRYDAGEDQRCLLDQVRDLLEPGANRSRGSAGKRSHSPAPLAVHVLDLLMTVEQGARGWHQTFHLLLDDPWDGQSDVPRLDAQSHLRVLPDYVDKFGSPIMTEAVTREVRYWHSRALAALGVSSVEQRYLLTEDAAKRFDKSTEAFRSWARRRGLAPVGYLPIPHEGGGTRQGVWDMSELQRYANCAVQ